MHAADVLCYVTATTEAHRECTSCVLAAAASVMASLAASAVAAKSSVLFTFWQLLRVGEVSRLMSKQLAHM